MSWITDHWITFFSSEISSADMLMLKDQSSAKYQMLNKTLILILVEEALHGLLELRMISMIFYS